jgi:biotin carboxyl carrier protein
MKTIGCAALLIFPIALVMFFAWLVMFVLSSVLAGESVRTTRVMPGAMSQVVGDRIDTWVLAGYEPDKLKHWVPPPEANEEPDDQADQVDVGGQYTGTVPERTDCKQPYGWPMEGVVSQEFSASHSGIDIVSGSDNAPIMATMCGTVVYAGWNTQGYGNLVIISNGEYKTYYAHQSEVFVESGAQVEIGDTVGLEGKHRPHVW